MASKKTKAADDNLDVDELFSDITKDSKPKKAAAAGKSSKPKASDGDDDLLADLESQLASQQVSSRPHTPRLSKDTKRPSAAAVAAETAARKSTDSARSLKPSLTPSATSSELHESEKRAAPVEQQQPAGEQAGGGWWGGWISTATATANAAMKQAEAAYKEIQHNEEAKKWTEQVRGIKGIDVGALRHYGRHKATPACFKNLYTDFSSRR
jgi:hypothetical protein